jgi:transposase
MNTIATTIFNKQGREIILMPRNEIAPELKEQALMRLLPPYSWSLRQVAKEVGTSPTTIMKWRRQLEREGLLMPSDDNNDDCSASQIFTFVLESALFSEHELAEYCREKGLYVDQIKRWKQACVKANTPDSVKKIETTKASRSDKRRIKELEKELNRKEKALAETAALLVLREKFNAVWEDKEEE